MNQRYPVQPALASHNGKAIKQSRSGAACPVGYHIIVVKTNPDLPIDDMVYYVKD